MSDEDLSVTQPSSSADAGDIANGSSGDDSPSDEDAAEWHDGDGICPSTSQFNMCCRVSYDTWSSAAAAASRPSRDGPSGRLHIDAFLDLLRDVPAFFHDPPEDVDITGGRRSPLVLRSSIRLETTDDPACEQRWKTIDYLQCLGFPLPMTCETKKTKMPLPLSNLPDRQGYLTSIILAWSYIISCRWVEILQRAGQRSVLLHDQGKPLRSCFWDLIIQSRWSAQVESVRRTFYAPWMLRKDQSSNPEQRYRFEIPPEERFRVKLAETRQ
ncbi:hypothetical protein VTN02DRAFT_3329 [Thermoascus thermophilus]